MSMHDGDHRLGIARTRRMLQIAAETPQSTAQEDSRIRCLVLEMLKVEKIQLMSAASGTHYVMWNRP